MVDLSHLCESLSEGKYSQQNMALTCPCALASGVSYAKAAILACQRANRQQKISKKTAQIWHCLVMLDEDTSEKTTKKTKWFSL